MLAERDEVPAARDWDAQSDERDEHQDGRSGKTRDVPAVESPAQLNDRSDEKDRGSEEGDQVLRANI